MELWKGLCLPTEPRHRCSVLHIVLLICLLHWSFLTPSLPLPLPLMTLMKAEKMEGRGARSSLRRPSLKWLLWVDARKLVRSVWEDFKRKDTVRILETEQQHLLGACGAGRSRTAFIGSYHSLRRGKVLWPEETAHACASLVFWGPFTSIDTEGVVTLTNQPVPSRQSSMKGEGRAPLEKQKCIPQTTAFGVLSD